MPEFEYCPDLCLLCLHEIAPGAGIVIADDGISVPLYMHLDCLLESPQLAADTIKLMLSKEGRES